MSDYKSLLFELDELMLKELNKIAQPKEIILPFVEAVESLFATFIDFVKSKKTEETIATHLYDAPDVKRMVLDACKEIINMLKSYQEGNILDAYKFVNRRFRLTGNKIYTSYHFPIYRIHKSNKWYRIRKKEDQPFERKDLFHVPFEKRNKVGTYRYSIPGYPALYLGSSLYCCWLETRQPREFAFSIFDVQKDIDVMDFRFFPDILDNTQEVKHLMSYPFKIVCAVISQEKKNYIPEYVFPQLMIHAILKQSRYKRDTIGLLYTSTNAYGILNRENCRYYDNLVVPAVIRKKEDDESLEDIFYLSEPTYINTTDLISTDSFMQIQQKKHFVFQKT